MCLNPVSPVNAQVSLCYKGSAGGAREELHGFFSHRRTKPHPEQHGKWLSHLLLHHSARRGCCTQRVFAHLLQVWHAGSLSSFIVCCKASACNTQKTIFLFPLCALINRECLKGTILNSQDAEVSCPEACECKLQDREIKAVIVTLFHSVHAKNLADVIIITVNCCFIVIAAPEWWGALALPWVTPEHRRKPRWSQLSLSDYKLQRLVYLRGCREWVPLRTLWSKQLHSVQGGFLCMYI